MITRPDHGLSCSLHQSVVCWDCPGRGPFPSTLSSVRGGERGSSNPLSFLWGATGTPCRSKRAKNPGEECHATRLPDATSTERTRIPWDSYTPPNCCYASQSQSELPPVLHLVALTGWTRGSTASVWALTVSEQCHCSPGTVLSEGSTGPSRLALTCYTSSSRSLHTPFSCSKMCKEECWTLLKAACFFMRNSDD